MENEHVLSALSRKRAEIAGEVGRLTEIIDGLQRDLVCVDRAICLFDPKADPGTIAPVRKRHRALSPRVFRHGDFSRGILGVLRDAKAPMTARDIAVALSAEHGLPTDPASIKGMVDRVRGMLARQRAGVLERIDVPDGRVAWIVSN
jgi:hypothetical protein